MPKQSSHIGLQILYPDNWTLSGPVEDDESAGIIIESPDGMFLSVNRYNSQSDPLLILDQATEAMKSEYEEVEWEALVDEDALPVEQGYELQFYCKNLIVTSRMITIPDGEDTLLIQMQAENRDFDRNEMVFAAMLKTIRDSLASQ